MSMSTSTKLEERISKFNILYFENHNILNTFIKTICPVTGKYKCKCYNNFGKNIQNFIVLKRDVFACYLHFNNVIIVKMERKAGQFYSKQKLLSNYWHYFRNFFSSQNFKSFIVHNECENKLKL